MTRPARRSVAERREIGNRQTRTAATPSRTSTPRRRPTPAGTDWGQAHHVQAGTSMRHPWPAHVDQNNGARTANSVIASANRLIDVLHVCWQQQDHGDERARVADADPPHEVHDRKAPPHRVFDAPDTDALDQQLRDGQQQHVGERERKQKADHHPGVVRVSTIALILSVTGRRCARRDHGGCAAADNGLVDPRWGSGWQPSIPKVDSRSGPRRIGGAPRIPLSKQQICSSSAARRHGLRVVQVSNTMASAGQPVGTRS